MSLKWECADIRKMFRAPKDRGYNGAVLYEYFTPFMVSLSNHKRKPFKCRTLRQAQGERPRRVFQ
jgi:hypothetical protein